MKIQVTCPECGKTLVVDVDIADPTPIPSRRDDRPPYTGGEDGGELREYMRSCFSIEELRLLVEKLGVGYQDVRGYSGTPEDYALQIVLYFGRRRRLQELVQALGGQ